MKDKMCGNFITEFVGLRSKMYSMKSETAEIKKIQGSKKTYSCLGHKFPGLFRLFKY